MIQFQQVSTKDAAYAFLEELLHESFPQEERRDDALQRDYTDNSPFFYANVIKDGEEPIGLITYWKLDDILYVEHLAVSPLKRNGGYGAKVMSHLLQTAGVPVILEVELPETEMSRRRIGFYERCGFKLCLLPYRQPPYRKGDDFLPMFIMYTGIEDIAASFERIKQLIYYHVYGVTEC